MKYVGILGHKLIVYTLCSLLLLCGIWSVLNNKIQLLPDVEPPRISFSVIWPGASEEFLTSDIVNPYEQAILGRLERFKSLNVRVSDESARFEVEFEYGVDLDDAEKELAALLSRARSLPLNVPPIEFQHGGRNVSNRVVGSYFIVSDSGEFNSRQEKLLRDLATYQLRLLKGVDRVELNPQLDSQLLIMLDMDKLGHLQLSYEQVRAAIRNLLSRPVTRLYEDGRVITAQYKAIDSIELIGKTPVAFVNGVSILLEDVSSIEVKSITRTAVARYNGKNAISMRVLREAGANLVEVQKLVEAVLNKNMNRIEASGLTFNLSFDTAVFVERAILWVLGSLATGFLLSLFVSYIFFKRFLPTVLSGVITLLSVCGIFLVLNISNASINVITLAGITFATGMFVDGVLIFIEYLDRQVTKSIGEIRQALKRIIPAVTASTLTTVIVFLPVIASDGAEGQLFRGLSIAMVSGLLIALVLTILIIPFFADRFLRNGLTRPEKKLSSNSVKFYMELTANKRSATILALTIFIGSIFGVGVSLPSMSYLPSVKRDAIDVFIPLSGAETIEKIEDNILMPLQEALQSSKSSSEINNSYSLAWHNFATGAIRLKDKSQISNVVAYLQKDLKERLPNSRVMVLHGELLSGVEEGNSIQLQIFVSDQKWLASKAKEIRELVNKHLPGVALRFEPNIEGQSSVHVLEPKMEKLRNIGVSVEELKNLVSALGRSDFIGKWSYQGEVINAVMTVDAQTKNYSEMAYVTRNAELTYLGELINVEQKMDLPSLSRVNGTPALLLNMRINDPELTVSDAVATLNEHLLPDLNKLISDKGFLNADGSAASIHKARNFLIFMLAFLMISFFLIVAIFLRSAKLSLYILMTLPTAIFGGVLGYKVLSLITKADFNVLSMLGFMIMLGVVANNSILLVDTIRNHFITSKSIPRAVELGGNERYRAIIISSLTTIAGMLPLLLLPSDASVIYQGIAAIIIGGMIINLITVQPLIFAMVKIFGLPGIESATSFPNKSIGRTESKAVI